MYLFKRNWDVYNKIYPKTIVVEKKDKIAKEKIKVI
jgi:hypothetical protein